MNDKFVCFRDGEGFIIYNPSERELFYTLELAAASEADKASWKALMKSRKLEDCRLLSIQP